jgi:hypothetical protein
MQIRSNQEHNANRHEGAIREVCEPAQCANDDVGVISNASKSDSVVVNGVKKPEDTCDCHEEKRSVLCAPKSREDVAQYAYISAHCNEQAQVG